MVKDDGYLSKVDSSSLSQEAAQENATDDGPLRVSRRSFLISTGVLVGSSGLAFAQCPDDPEHWNFEIFEDKDFPTRRGVKIFHDNGIIRTDRDTVSKDPKKISQSNISLREIQFGERAKISLQADSKAIPRNVIFSCLDKGKEKKIQHNYEVVDQSLIIRGLELARDRSGSNFFNLVLKFTHARQPRPDSKGTPTFDDQVQIFAQGWKFGTGIALTKPMIWEKFSEAKGSFPVLADAPDKALTLIRQFITSIFGSSVILENDKLADINLALPTEVDPLRWQIEFKDKAKGADGRFVLLTNSLNKIPSGKAQSKYELYSGKRLTIFRQLGALRKSKDSSKNSKNGSTLQVGDLDDAATVGLLYRDPKATSNPIFGSYKIGGEHSADLKISELNQIALNNQDNKTPPSASITRYDAASLAAEKDADMRRKLVTEIADICGDLTIESKLSQGALRIEGPFDVTKGVLTKYESLENQNCSLTGTMQLEPGPNRLANTAFGPIEWAGPEERKVYSEKSKQANDVKTIETGGDAAFITRNSPEFVIASPVNFLIENGTIKEFELTARIYSLGVFLAPDTVDYRHAQPEKVMDSVAKSYRTDLAFPGGTEVLFRLHELHDKADNTARIGLVTLSWVRGKDEIREFGPPLSVPLENAVLRLTRWSDLVALTYRFSGLDLAFEGQRFELRPRGLARAAALQPQNSRFGPGKNPAVVSVATDITNSRADPRPLMVVEFPPQHVAEEAFLTQRQARPLPPNIPWSAISADKLDDLTQAFDNLRKLYSTDGSPYATDLATKRQDARKNINKQIHDLNTAPSNKELSNFILFLKAWNDKLKEPKSEFDYLSEEQKIYVGPEFLNPPARLLAEQVADKLLGSSGENLDFVPEDPVTDAEMDVFQRGLATNLEPQKKIEIVDAQRTARRNSRDPFFLIFKKDYDKWNDVYPNGPVSSEGRLKALSPFKGRSNILKTLADARKDIAGESKLQDFDKNAAKFKKELAQLITKVDSTSNFSGEEKPNCSSRSRLSGPSRLAFRINTDDFDPNFVGGVIPFTADNLTNWSRYELAVIRRAEKLFRPFADGSSRPQWDRQEDEELAHQLLHQGFSRGGMAPTQDGDKPQLTSKKEWQGNPLTVEQRLAEVVTLASTAPNQFETAIEIPFRLQLSPSQDARFRTRRVVPDYIFAEEPCSKYAVPQVSPLWRAELDVSSSTALRAVWSQDFRPEAFLPRTDAQADSYSLTGARVNGPPPRGPYPPWAIGRDDPKNLKANKFRTSLDAFDRHELVGLSSVHGLPVIGRVSESGQRLGVDQREPPEGFQIATGHWSSHAADVEKTARYNDIYIARKFDTDGLQLALSSLGGFLRVNTSFDPPASVLDGRGQSLFPALNIERWRHYIVLGRDISAEVVYKGYLFPVGIRAALIKITERRFEIIAGREGPVAVLRQRMFIRIGKPEKEFGAYKQADDGRRVPFRKFKILTTTTPDIIDPYDNNSDNGSPPQGVYASGRIALEKGAGTAFWPRVAKRPGSEVRFNFLLDDQAHSSLPLIFVDNTAANDKASLEALCKYYNAINFDQEPPNNSVGVQLSSLLTSRLVSADFGGAKLTYAPEWKKGDTQYETLKLVLAAEGYRSNKIESDTDYQPIGQNTNFASDVYLQGHDQPPFFPAMRFAQIRFGQMEGLTGKKADPVCVTYDPTYALFGFDNIKSDDPKSDSKNPQAIFLSVLAPVLPMDFGNSGERGGAVGRPEHEIWAVSRLHGLMASLQQDQSASNNIDAPLAIAKTYRKSSTDDTKPKAAGFPAPIRLASIGSTDGLLIAEATGKTAEKPSDSSKSRDSDAFFGRFGTILGIVKIKDLISLMAEADFPKLHELTEFGHGLVGDAALAIRNNLLVPLKDLLNTLDDLFTSAQKEINAKSPPGAESPKLRQIYADIENSRKALSGSVDEALQLPSDGSENPLVAIGLYTEIYTRGRAMIEALERTLRDPIRPLTEDIRSKIESYSAKLVDGITDGVSEKLKGFASNLNEDKIREYVRDNIFVPGVDVIFLPPAEIFSLLSGYENYKSALKDSINNQNIWNNKDALLDIENFKKLLSDNIKKAFNTSKTDFDNYNPEGLLWDEAIEIAKIAAILINAIKAAKANPSNIPQSLNALSNLGTPAKALQVRLHLLSKFANNAAVSFSADKICETLQDISQVILDPDLFTKVPACITDENSPCKTWQDNNSTMPFVEALSRLDYALGEKSNNGADIGSALTSLQNAIANKDSLNIQIESIGRIDRINLHNIFLSLRNIVLIYNKINIEITNCSKMTPNIDVIAKICNLESSLFSAIKSLFVSVSNLDSKITNPLPSLVDQLTSNLDELKPRTANSASNYKPVPFDDPASWTWVKDPGSVAIDFGSNQAAILEMINRDIFGLIFPVLKSVADFIPKITILGASDGTRINYLEKLSAKLKSYTATGQEFLAYSKKISNDYSPLRIEINKYSDDVEDIISGKPPVHEENIDHFISAWKTGGNIRKPLDALSQDLPISDKTKGRIQNEIDRFANLANAGLNDVFAVEDFILSVAVSAAAKLQDQINNTKLAAANSPGLRNVADALFALFDVTLGKRNKLFDEIVGPPGLQYTTVEVKKILSRTLIAPSTLYDSKPTDAKNDDDLALQTKALDTISTTFKNSNDDAKKPKAVDNLFELLQGWSDGKQNDPLSPLGIGDPNAIVTILSQSKLDLGSLLRDLIRGQVAAIIDFDAIRREIENRIRQLIPTRQTLAYDFGVEVSPFANLFIPDKGTRLTLKSKTTIDLLHPGDIQVSTSGALGPFKVKLLGDAIDICTLSFDGARYGSETGGKFKANITGFEPGAAVSFLQQLSSFLSFGANGFYLKFLFAPPGIEAGYMMPPTGFSLGVMGVVNLSLNIGVLMPFDGSPALFKVGFSSPEMPFLINIGIYGGGGHLALYANPSGIIGFEASFEFGAVVTFTVGPLEGDGRVTAGIFLRTFTDASGNKVSTIEGLVTAAGACHLMMFHMSAMLQVRVGSSAESNDNLVGTATFTFSFSWGLSSVSYRVTAHQKMPKGFAGGNGVIQANSGAQPDTMFAKDWPSVQVADLGDAGWKEAAALPVHRPASLSSVPNTAESSGIYYSSKVVSKGDNYAKYESYFDPEDPVYLPSWSLKNGTD